MSIKNTLVSLSVLLTSVSVNHAATLSLPVENPTGKHDNVGSINVFFDANVRERSGWDTSLVNQQEYTINSLSIKKADYAGGHTVDENWSNLWIGVYYTTNGPDPSFSNISYLGSSVSSAAWGDAEAGDDVTWTFSEISAEVINNGFLFFAFHQTEDEVLTAWRTSGGNHLPVQVGPWDANAQGAGFRSASSGGNNGGVPAFVLQITPIPEPSFTAMILSVGLLLCARRR